MSVRFVIILLPNLPTMDIGQKHY